jgi:hypothetical protein
MGGLPLPDDMAATRNFTAAIEKRIDEGAAVFIYPEAHIWPYYTKIRPFGDASFSYPIKQNTPVFCFTHTYQKKGKSEHPQIVTYIDGPFYPDEALPPRERRRKICEEVYAAMCKRAENSDVCWIEYVDGRNNKEEE